MATRITINEVNTIGHFYPDRSLSHSRHTQQKPNPIVKIMMITCKG